jgi:hypothetical protein
MRWNLGPGTAGLADNRFREVFSLVPIGQHSHEFSLDQRSHLIAGHHGN